jgi:pimeloyl-ACP methyl ester carboxylesterase
VTLAVASDHYTLGSAPWDITFAIQRAKGKRLGTFVMVAGGPGGSGISVADSYTDDFPARVANNYDYVYPDQRGIGLSHPIGCPDATAAFYTSPVDPQDPAQAEAAGAAAKAYADACVDEAKIPDAELPLYSTQQAIEDLEAIREYLNVDKLDLYGESYGTQFVQTYAAAHPDHIRTLYLDGPVDLTLDGATYLGEATRSFDGALISTLNTCATRPTCRADFEGQDPLAAFDALQAKVRAGPISYDFPMGDGTVQRRSFGEEDLEDATAGYMYSVFDRSVLTRALAASVDGNLVPLARLAAASLIIDPDTLKPIPDPTWSDAMYYAVECQDYVYSGGQTTDEARLQAFLDAAKTLGVTSARLPSIYYADMPCLYWPNHPATDPRPAPIVAATYSTWIMVATADPITPPANAMRLASRLDDVHVILETGGPHVIYGWGLSCPDDVVADYLVKGKVPSSRITVCKGSVVDPYVPLAHDTEAEYPTALALMSSLATQVQNTNDYAELLDKDPIKMGCDYGGSLVYTPGEHGTNLEFKACELIDGVALTGTGAIDDDSGDVTMTVTLPDGSLRYRAAGSGTERVTGTFRGREIDERG